MAQFMKIMACRNVGSYSPLQSPLPALSPFGSCSAWFIRFTRNIHFNQSKLAQLALLPLLHPTKLESQRVNFSFRHEANVFLYSPPPAALAKAASKQLNNYVYVKNYNKIITALLTPMYLLQVLNLQYVAFQSGENFVESRSLRLR